MNMRLPVCSDTHNLSRIKPEIFIVFYLFIYFPQNISEVKCEGNLQKGSYRNITADRNVLPVFFVKLKNSKGNNCKFMYWLKNIYQMPNLGMIPYLMLSIRLKCNSSYCDRISNTLPL